MLSAFANKWDVSLYAIFRIMVGLLFFMHGLQKLFGIGGDSVPLMTLVGLAGIIELVGGLMLALGFFTRWAALVCAVQMMVAYVMFHAPSGLSPLANKGELALLYFAAFLVLLGKGAGEWSIDKALGWD